MHPTLHCTVLIWVALERGCGCRLSSRQPKAAPAHSRDAVGDRNLLNPEMGGRQLSVTYSLQRWDLPWVGAKVFRHSLQGIPDSWAPQLVVPAICGGKVPSGTDAVLPVLSPRLQRFYSILSSGKAVILLWKWWDFPDLFSSTAVRAWSPGRGREEGSPQLLPLKVISGCPIKLSAFR